MLTRIEIDGFKTFENFALDLRPLTAIVGPNASGKSNLFDALRFLSLLTQTDIRTAMQDLRGEPEELFRQTSSGPVNQITFAVEVLLSRRGTDNFGTRYETPAQRLRYELTIEMVRSGDGSPRGVYVRNELCRPIAKRDDTATFLRGVHISYNARINPFIRLNDSSDAILVRQDGRQKHGRPVQLPLREASRSALSTITTAEFPHLYAIRDLLGQMRFLEINPKAARKSNDRFEDRILKPDASNLATVLARLKYETGNHDRPDGVLADIASDLASLIPSVSSIQVSDDANQKQYSFSIRFVGDLSFSSRVISDGTLRLLALLTVLDDPERQGTLCFEEPENGVHEGRVPMLIEFLRNAAQVSDDPDTPSFQVLLNTHSPKVMAALRDEEIVAADSVVTVRSYGPIRSVHTRMRTGVGSWLPGINPATTLTRSEVERLLQHPRGDA